MLYGRFFYVMIIVWFEMIFKRKFSGRFLSIVTIYSLNFL